MKVNEKDEKDGVAVSPQPSPANGIVVSEKFKLTYYGCLVIDKRYTSCMLPWIVAEIKRKCERQVLDVVVENTQVCGTSKDTAIEHGLVSISKCIKLEGKEASTFAYLTKDPTDTASCSCHVFEAENTSKASKFLTTLKKALEECKRQQPVRQANGIGNDAPTDQAPKCDVTQFNVTYVGKLAVSHRKAPPTLIDTSVERFRHHNQQVLLTTRLNSMKKDQVEETHDDDEKAKDFPSAKISSFDEQQKHLSVEDLTVARPRSVSDDGTSHHKGYMASHSAKPPRKISSVFSESRNLVMSISVNSVSFSSSISGSILMERKVQEISFCQQGTVEPEHFGFICHDATSSRYFCYVFRAESKQAVDSIMKSLKQAFTSAWQAVGSSAPCENCPLRKLHCLCQSLEGEKPVDQEITIRHHLFDNLGDSVVDELRRKCQSEAKRRDVVEQNEIMMSLLRQLYEEMQKVHRHSPNGQILQSDNANKEKPPTKFIEKAKRSLGDIFGRSKSRNVKSDQEVSSSDEADCKVVSNRLAAPVPQKKISLTDNMPPPMQSITEVQKKPRRTHRRSYSDITQIYKSPSKINKDISESREHVSDEESFVVQNMKNESTRTTPKKSGITRKQSYRRAIFDSVVTPAKLPDSDPIPENAQSHEKKSREQLRALWRKAIMDQCTLIRMEKENSKLKAGEGIAFNKRLKLEYEEVLPSNTCSETWAKLLAAEKMVEKEDLIQAIKQGVPKKRRGEIWQFLIKQDQLRNKRSNNAQQPCYKELKERTSIHQHAILIDCNRTFPAHPYFSQQVGVGQFALFNLLKVYSNLDSELGYCQGLSFVAGILLMHLGEEEAFDVLVHLNYNYGLRQQYMPDMAGLRVQFYQYSRLLHDCYPNLHDHFENYEVSPALYAASWFLTLFASLFPVSFASRVLDLVSFAGLQMIFKVAISMVGRFQDQILARESFETIVDFLKTDLPKLAAVELESIVEDVLALEIGDQLLRFEIEYQVFQEDEINPSLIKPLLDKNEKLAHENSSLKNKVNYLKNELHEYRRKERNMAEKIKKLQSENDRLLMLASHTRKSVNGDDLVNSQSGLQVENCTSPTDENTSDSFEHITGAEETDDDIDALSCDSPLTIEDYLSEKENSPVISSPRPIDESTHSWTKL